MKMKMNTSKRYSFLFGAAAGAAVALLLIQKKGNKSRKVEGIAYGNFEGTSKKTLDGLWKPPLSFSANRLQKIRDKLDKGDIIDKISAVNSFTEALDAGGKSEGTDESFTDARVLFFDEVAAAAEKNKGDASREMYG